MQMFIFNKRQGLRFGLSTSQSIAGVYFQESRLETNKKRLYKLMKNTINKSIGTILQCCLILVT